MMLRRSTATRKSLGPDRGLDCIGFAAAKLLVDRVLPPGLRAPGMKRSVLVLAWLAVVLAFGPAPAAASKHDQAQVYSATMDVHAIDAELDARPEDAELTPSISAEEFRTVVAQVKADVL